NCPPIFERWRATDEDLIAALQFSARQCPILPPASLNLLGRDAVAAAISASRIVSAGCRVLDPRMHSARPTIPLNNQGHDPIGSIRRARALPPRATRPVEDLRGVGDSPEIQTWLAP